MVKKKKIDQSEPLPPDITNHETLLKMISGEGIRPAALSLCHHDEGLLIASVVTYSKRYRYFLGSDHSFQFSLLMWPESNNRMNQFTGNMWWT